MFQFAISISLQKFRTRLKVRYLIRKVPQSIRNLNIQCYFFIFLFLFVSLIKNNIIVAVIKKVI